MSYSHSRKRDQFLPFPADASQAEIIAYQADEQGVCDWPFRRNILDHLPDRFAVPIAQRYYSIHQAKGRASGNEYLLDVQDELSSLSISLAANDDDLVAFAKNAARDCSDRRSEFKTATSAYEYLVPYIRNRYGINPPLAYQVGVIKIPVTVTAISEQSKQSILCNGNRSVTDTVTENPKVKRKITLSVIGVINRLCNEYWWRRMLRNITSRNVEQHAIGLGLVHRKAGIYISDESNKRKQQQKRRNRLAMQKCELVNELGQEYNLQELIDRSLANPANRRAELMVRIRGTEEFAKTCGHDAVLYTITCPSRFHSRKSKSGQANPKYDGSTPREAQKYLTKQWARMRAQLTREGCLYYGFRVVEPHHDATPHWHLLLFIQKDHIKTVSAVLRKYAMQESPNESGAKKHRFTELLIDPKKGSATGYIAKYISKNIDGYGVDEDVYGEDAKDSAKRISNWASVWGIRQFQQIGGPPVTLYRELRRIQGGSLQGLLLEAWQAADSSNWEKFIKLMGGGTVSRKDCPLKIARQWSDEPNCYAEPKGYEIIGVEMGSVMIPTRIHQWVVKSSPNCTQVNKIYKSEFVGPPLMPLNWVKEDFKKDGPSFLGPLEFCQ